MKKRYSFFLLIFLFLFSCKNLPDYNGIYQKQSGNCKNEFIALKKMQGFADKYYLVTVFDKGQTQADGREFLGIVYFERNLIKLKSGTIQILDDKIIVQTIGKECIYKKTASISY